MNDSNIALAAKSLGRVLSSLAVPGVLVFVRDAEIVADFNEDSVEWARRRLEQLTAGGWEKWPVRIERSRAA